MKPVSVLALTASGVLASVGGRCPPTGAVLPAPHIPARLDPSGLRSKLDALQSDAKLGWNVTTTSFSVALTSGAATFFEYHHTAPVRSARGGVSNVDGDTVYRIMSVTKMFNVLALLLNAPEKLDAPIGRYVPELQGVEEYKDITLRMLAGQMSGVPRNGRAFDLYETNGNALVEAGFPEPEPKDMPTCDSVVSGPCSRKDFFNNLLEDSLDWLPGDRIAYSNQAYTLLSFALHSMTGKPLAELVRANITTPLNLSWTGFDAPELSRAIIPAGPGEVFMGLDLGNFNATAGIYSTPNDLTAFVRSILRSTLLSPARTREWLKPGGFAAQYSMAVGAPWEIYRLSRLTPDNRVIDVYTKSGDLPGYSAYMVVLPDYDVGATIMASGVEAQAPSALIFDMVAKALIPAVDFLARDEAKAMYAGRYVEAADGLNNTDSASSPAASLDLDVDNGPGLKIKSWTNNGKPVLLALASKQGIEAAELDARLYPVGEGNRWRLSLEKIFAGNLDPSAPSSACQSWAQVDQLRWGSLPVDEFRFEVTGGGVVKGVKNLGLRANLSKQKRE